MPNTTSTPRARRNAQRGAGQTSAAALQLIELKARAVELRLQNRTEREIAAELGKSPGTVHGWLMAARDELLPVEDVETLRRVTLTQLRMAAAKWMPLATGTAGCWINTKDGPMWLDQPPLDQMSKAAQRWLDVLESTYKWAGVDKSGDSDDVDTMRTVDEVLGSMSELMEHALRRAEADGASQ